MDSKTRRSFIKGSLAKTLLAADAGVVVGLINTPGSVQAATAAKWREWTEFKMEVTQFTVGVANGKKSQMWYAWKAGIDTVYTTAGNTTGPSQQWVNHAPEATIPTGKTDVLDADRNSSADPTTGSPVARNFEWDPVLGVVNGQQGYTYKVVITFKIYRKLVDIVKS